MSRSAFDALQSGNAPAAEGIARRALLQYPGNEDALLVLALSLDAQARYADALDIFQQLSDANPSVPEYKVNLGALLRTLGREREAQDSYAAALALDAGQVEALRGLGEIATNRGDLRDARDRFVRAQALAPDDALVRAQAAKACQTCGDTDGVNTLLADWRRWSVADPTSLADVAWTLTGAGRYDEAESALRLAAALRPADARVHLRMAALYERTNRVAEARSALDRVNTDTDPTLREEVSAVRALVAARSDDAAEAIRLHEALVADLAAARRHLHLVFGLARLYDRAGRPDAAMAQLSRAHAIQLQQLFPDDPTAAARIDTMAITRTLVTPEIAAQWPDAAAPDAAASPVFIVGFPRSGTTLLESMLDAHPALTTMDERAFIQDLIDTMQDRGLRYPLDLGKLSAHDCETLRTQYRDAVRTQTAADPARRLVDKNPLNILRLPMIARLFPHARIILSLRHPCDVVLSNYMQLFQSPSYAAMCADLQTLARGYADAFDFWLDQARVFGSPVLELRHEDLVDDLPAAAAAVADFLGIERDARMHAFDRRSRERGFISTPSYHQVVEPLNRKGVGRWQRYRRELEPALPYLDPYLRRWNYAANS